MGPVQVAGLTYLLAGIVSFGVAGVIKLLFGIINVRKNRVLIKIVSANHVRKAKMPFAGER